MENMYSVVSGSKVHLLTSSRKDAMRKFFKLAYCHFSCVVLLNDDKVIAKTRF